MRCIEVVVRYKPFSMSITASCPSIHPSVSPIQSACRELWFRRMTLRLILFPLPTPINGVTQLPTSLTPVASTSRSATIDAATPSSHFYYRQIGRRPTTSPRCRLLAIQRISNGSIAINRNSQLLASLRRILSRFFSVDATTFSMLRLRWEHTQLLLCNNLTQVSWDLTILSITRNYWTQCMHAWYLFFSVWVWLL